MTQISRVRADPLPGGRPAGVAGIRRPGIVPRRLLMFGGGVLTGLGLADHGDGLPGAVADALARGSRRGVDITVVVEPDPLSRRALDGLRGLRLRRFDAVIVVLGARRGRGGVIPTPWDQSLERLAALLGTECAEHAPAFIYDSSPAIRSSPDGEALPSSHGIRRAAAGEVPESASRVRFRELPPQPAVLGAAPPFSPVTYEGWAELIVQRLDLEIAELQAALGGRPAPSLAYQQDDETLRQRALRGIRLGAGNTRSLELLVREARVIFGTAGAALVIVDCDEARPELIVGLPTPSVLRNKALSNIAIQSDRPAIISDTHRDPRVPARTAEPGGADVRFYAAYPIHTWDGYRIGALCIYDTSPRDVSVTDLAELWALTGQIEQELWSAALRGRPLSRSATATGEPRTQPTRWGALKARWTR